MAKYNYDKKVLKGLTPGAFLGEVKTRTKAIEAAEDSIPNSIYNPNILAKKLHPSIQHVVVSKVIDHGDAKSFILVPNESKGTKELAFFRASQYITVFLYIDGSRVTKPYAICSSPKDALGDEKNSYMITVKQSSPGFASTYILNNWEKGTEAEISGPQGELYYQELRDAKNIIALAGGSGVTPFYSMAAAVADKIEDFNLTILYGAKTENDIILKDELQKIESKSNGKVKVIYILSDEEKSGFEHGFLTADLIKKYATDGDYSVFICGSNGFIKFAEGECKKLKLAPRRIRKELSGDYQHVEKDKEFPKEFKNKEFKLTVNVRGQKQEVPCNSQESLLVSMEKAGINAPSRCRSGECGWCHSKLDSGEVYIPKSVDGRRMGDKKFGWVHPCCTYPLSDIELTVYTVLKDNTTI